MKLLIKHVSVQKDFSFSRAFSVFLTQIDKVVNPLPDVTHLTCLCTHWLTFPWGLGTLHEQKRWCGRIKTLLRHTLRKFLAAGNTQSDLYVEFCHHFNHFTITCRRGGVFKSTLFKESFRAKTKLTFSLFHTLSK